MKDETVMYLIMAIILSIPAFIFWAILFGGALYPEDRIITIESVNYHSFITSTSWRTGEETSRYTEMRIIDIDGNHYEYSALKHIDNPMFANINNGWIFAHNKTIESGGTYKITLWHSIFGGYTKDGLSNWNPNPEISKIIRLDI
jgi:hypothetical protein